MLICLSLMFLQRVHSVILYLGGACEREEWQRLAKAEEGSAFG